MGSPRVRHDWETFTFRPFPVGPKSTKGACESHWERGWGSKMMHVYPFFLLSGLFHSKLFCISASKDSLQKKKKSWFWGGRNELLRMEKRKKKTFSLEKKIFWFQMKSDSPFSNEKEKKNVDTTSKRPLSTSLTLGEHLPGLWSWWTHSQKVLSDYSGREGVSDPRHSPQESSLITSGFSKIMAWERPHSDRPNRPRGGQNRLAAAWTHS